MKILYRKDDTGSIKNPYRFVGTSSFDPEVYVVEYRIFHKDGEMILTLHYMPKSVFGEAA